MGNLQCSTRRSGKKFTFWIYIFFFAHRVPFINIQGLLIAVLVSCNCKILKLYSAPKSKKLKKGPYKSLKDGEGGRYGVLSITNPNYEETPNITTAGSDILAVTTDETSLARFGYANDDNFVDRSEYISTSPTEIVCGELLSALPVKNLGRGPTPAPV